MFDPMIMSKLNRLLEGGGYSEPGKTLIEATLTDGNFVQPDNLINLEAGKTYFVHLDSGTYEAKCKADDMHFVEPARYLGNYSFVEAEYEIENTGESFLVIEFPGGEAPGVAIRDANGGAKVTVELAETLHLIDPKYLPGVCLPVVELTTVATTEGAALTEEESARMDEVAALGVPIVAKFTMDGATFTMPLSAFVVDNGVVFSADLMSTNFQITNQSGAWAFVYTVG